MNMVAWINKIFGRDQKVDPLVELQYQTMVGTAARAIPREVLERPDLVVARNEFRKIEAIEGELIHHVNKSVAQRLLEPFLSRTDPWLRARAARALHHINPHMALQALHRLAK